MGRPGFLTVFFLMVFIPAVMASEKPAKISKKNSRTHCRAKTVIRRYPVVILNKKEAEKNKKLGKSKRGKYSFPV